MDQHGWEVLQASAGLTLSLFAATLGLHLCVDWSRSGFLTLALWLLGLFAVAVCALTAGRLTCEVGTCAVHTMSYLSIATLWGLPAVALQRF